MQSYGKMDKKAYLCTMNYRKTLIFLFFMAVSAVRGQELFIPAEPAPKREVRAVWLTTLNGLDWPKAKATNEAGRSVT